MLRHIRNLVLSTLISLLLAEIAARVALSVDPLLHRVRGVDEPSRRLSFVERHSHGQAMTFSFDVYDSLRGWALAPDIRDLSVFEGKILNSNSRGIRGTTEYSYARVPGKHRILLLGDSFTFGEEVSDRETFSSILADSLPGTEVLNLGVHGYGHDQMLLYLKSEGVKYHPDVVILGYLWFDQDRNLLSFNDFAKPRFEVTADGLRLHGVPVPTPQAVLAREPYRSKLADLVIMTGARIRERLVPDEDRAQGITWAIFDDLVKTVRSNGATPLFVYLPARGEAVDVREGMTEHERALDQYCRSRGVECLFLRPRFREAVLRGVTFKTRRHWGVNGHQLVAQGIRDFLTGRGLLTAGDSVVNPAPTEARVAAEDRSTAASCCPRAPPDKLSSRAAVPEEGTMSVPIVRSPPL